MQNNQRIIAIIVSLACCLSMTAAGYTIKGRVIDAQTKEAVEGASIRLMKADSAYVGGNISGKNGAFSVSAKQTGKMIVKISFIGYKPYFHNFTASSKQTAVNLGDIALRIDAVALKGATVSAKAAQVTVKEDTLEYNAAAYRVAEGSTLEALVEKLPGAEVDDDGNIKMNGKTISEIRVDGKDFFKGDTKVAMKNLPIELIDKIKAYDKQSDYTRQTGIDDGNEKTVLDVGLKQKIKSTWFSNIDLSAGTKHRYSGRVFVNRFTDNTRLTAFGSMNNVNDQGFGGGGGRFSGGGGGGLTATRTLGIDGFWNNGLKEDSAHYLQLGGGFNYSYRNNDGLSSSNSETFLTNSSQSSFSNSFSHNFNRSTNVRVNGRMEWKPDSMTWMTFRPQFNHSESQGHGISHSVTFNANPYSIDGMDSPLDSIFTHADPLQGNRQLLDIAVNRNGRQSLTCSNTNSGGAEIDITRNLNKRGRNISFNGDVDFSNSTSKSFSISDIYYYKTNKENYNNQYSDAPSKSHSYRGRVSYSEPLFIQGLFMQTSYDFSYKFSDRDRSLFQLDSLSDWSVGNTHPIGSLPSEDLLNTICRNAENSRYATYRDYVHDVNVGIRYNTKDINFSAGVRMQPQHTKLDYQKNMLDTTVTRDVFNVAPNVRLRWKFSQFTRLDLRYRGSSSQPSMTDMLDVRDDSDPLNITNGNPNLKPSWTNNFNLYYNTYSTAHQQSLFGYAAFSQTSNSISNAVFYDTETGVRETRPENINGNWNANAFLGYNRSFGATNSFALNLGTSFDYSNNVGYMSLGQLSNSVKNTVKNLGLGGRTRLTYRTGDFEIGVNGNLRFNKSDSKLQAKSNMETYTFRYGGNLQYNSPWGMSISTDMGMQSRRGYDDNSMNTNELIWNAQLSQTFLNKAATISLQLYDILHEQSNISRTITAQMRCDTWSNAIYNYAMVHFIYRLNIFGGSNGRINMNNFRGGGPGGPGGYGGRYEGGRYGGGYGGGYNRGGRM